jgi:histidine triad (HIT) family protein
MTDDCIFCRFAKGEIPVKKIYENENFFSIFDKNPLVNGHCLVISKKHFKTILDFPILYATDLIDCVKSTSIKILKDTNSSGFNLVNNNFESSGQVVPHFHLHIIPRKDKDGRSFELINKKD